MTKFKKRTKQPSKDNKYYNSNINPFVSAGYGMFQNNGNCTAYSYGRFYELIGSKPKLSTGNAENWYDKKDGYKRGQTPKLGAIICWRKGKAGNSKDGAGHVGVVEEIKSNGDILISNSGWKSFIFKTRTLKKSNNYGISGYVLQGFIYCPIEFEEDKPKKEEPKKEEPKKEEKKTYSNGAESFNSKYRSGKSYKTTADLHLRAGASTKHKSICVMPKGTKVTWYGFYTDSWKYVRVANGKYKGKVGFCSQNYLK